MSRFNLFLLLIVLGCALSVVRATHQQRRIFIELQRAQAQARQLQQDYAQLQYQQSALSKTSRIEDLATNTLKMRSATADRTQYLMSAPGDSMTTARALEPASGVAVGWQNASQPRGVR
jgi:cell division protein FtsL